MYLWARVFIREAGEILMPEERDHCPVPVSLLIVEDNEDDVLIVKEGLKKSGFLFEWAPTLAEARKLLQGGRFDLILLDLNLPDGRGVGIISKFAEEYPQIPVVVVTGIDDDATGLKAIRKGAQDYLVKSQLHTPLLRHVIRYAIERKNMALMKDHFINLLSHELRTPIFTLRETFEFLLSSAAGTLTEDQKRLLSLAQKTLHRMDRTASNLLDLAKIESGKMQLSQSVFDFSKLVRDIAESYERSLRKKGVELRLRLCAEPLSLAADYDKIGQVITNLLSNAAKFTERGFVEVVTLDRGELLEFRITDTGVGISRDHLDKVFDKFEQFGRAGKGAEKGTGLGLSLCKEMIRLHKGSMGVESELNQGSTFYFTIPIKQSV